MSKRPDNRFEFRANVILFLLTMWLGAELVSGWALFLRRSQQQGIGNLETALGWQGVASMLAFGIWAVALGLPRSNGIRRSSPLPLVATVVAGLAMWGLS